MIHKPKSAPRKLASRRWIKIVQSVQKQNNAYLSPANLIFLTTPLLGMKTLSNEKKYKYHPTKLSAILLEYIKLIQ